MKGQGQGDGRRDGAVCTVSLETPTSPSEHQATIKREETLPLLVGGVGGV